jgi:hypothetical protein
LQWLPKLDVEGHQQKEEPVYVPELEAVGNGQVRADAAARDDR